MLALDWRATPLGDPASWPGALSPALSICLGSGFPIAIYWGPSLALLYNDAWSPILGSKHPWALGRPAVEVWPEIWDTIGPMFAQVMATGDATYSEDQLLLMHRHGYTEECYFNFTFSPIRGEAPQVEGVFNAVIETTYRVIAERRTRLLRELAARVSAARTAEEAGAGAVEVLGGAPHDVPFCALYLAGEDGRELHLAASSGMPAETCPPRGPIDAAGGWPLSRARASGRVELVDDVEARFGGALPGHPWPEPARAALIAPLYAGGAAPTGYLILGASPRRAVDDEYRQLAERAAAHVSQALGNIAALELARRRAEALAQLDRAKTTFFSNISHELRTPLTLMLGPTEDALAAPDPALRGEALQVVHRNELRLLKLVNTLLDFSRIEAGRADVHLEPTDLGLLTAELVGTFRAAIDRAGLGLVLDVPAQPVEAWVDRDQWEKIILNLLSNALKHTFAGAIAVAVEAVADGVEVRVADSGVGIPAEHLPHVFERFHRVPAARARTHEGSGIGLALVNELVGLHRGRIAVESAVERGTTFRIWLPTSPPPGAERAPPRLRPSSSAAAAAFVSEASRWLPRAPEPAEPDPREGVDGPRVGEGRLLIADDNADMREYLARLLAPHFTVELAADGVAALEAFRRERPDVVLSDVMMPGLDGLGLLAAVRQAPGGRTTPVILLSARAGEEARIEGRGSGADDYLVKPFSARELVATVRAHAKLSAERRRAAASEEALRAEAARDLDQILSSVGEGFVSFDRALRYAYINTAAMRLMGISREEVLGRHPWDVFPPEVTEQGIPPIRQAMEEQRTIHYETYDPRLRRWYDCRVYPTPHGASLFFADVTARKADALALSQARDAADADAQRLNLALAASRLGDWSWSVDDDRVVLSPRAAEIFALPAGSKPTWAALRELLHPDDRERAREAVETSLREHRDYTVEYRVVHGGRERWVAASGRVRHDESGAAVGMLGVVQDITRDRVLVLVDDAVRPLTDPLQITSTTARVLGQHLDVDRCAYATVEDDQDTFVLTGNYTRGVASIIGRYTFGQFGAECLRLMRAGEPYVVTDCERDPRIDDASRASYRATQIRSVICVPILKAGRFVAAMAVHCAQPRSWSAPEVELVRQVASRSWESIERARAERDRAELLAAAESANRAKDEFMAMLGHELRNPLSPILTALQLMKLRGGPAHERERTVIERQVNHLTRLVDDLLDVSRIARGKVELKREVLELADVVSRSIEVASPLLEQRTQTLHVDVAPRGLSVDADPGRLAQVISNLLTNAAKYTPPSGRITVSGALEEGQVVLRVRDTGIGMAPEVLPRVFDMFVQGRQALDRAEGGLGLGLSIVRSLVERHGGDVAAYSEGLGRGSEFVVRLPRAAVPSAEPLDHHDAPSGRTLPSGLRILVVDDNTDAADMLGEVLRAQGHQVTVAHDAVTALLRAAGTRFDAAFLDIGLPVMDGYELAARLKQSPHLSQIRLIAVTGYGLESDRRKSAEAGFDHHLVKPIRVDAVISLLPT